MATLTETEKQQLRRARRTEAQPPRCERRPISEYLAFARFAARLAPPGKAKPIKGENWQL